MTRPTERVLQSACRSVIARRRIADLVRKTEVLPSRVTLDAGTEIHYKTENFQLTGSFKLRGASAKLSSLPVNRPVITASSGNHGIACSLAAQRTGHKLTVVLPENVIDQKRKSIEAFGTRIVIAGADSSLAEVHAKSLAEAEGHTYVSPYNDAEVIAGQGTVGLELLEQLPRIDNLFISMGGGGLISGIGSVLKSMSPNTRIIGVSATHTAALAASIKAGKVVETAHLDTLADGVAGGVDENSLTVPLASEVIDEIVHIDENHISEALRFLAWKENMIVEGAAALALAPLLAEPGKYAGKVNVVLLCGGNYGKDRMAAVLSCSG
ncbi:pyridoxal-phosphate dependent enzyme [Pseudophaeobacter sp.]|uniref:pyridoxal-phosphate dependent enzyme n=1 Tax=Pseudophaeobacter sp. TaxID=1971739 RepID=UPI004059E14F